MTTRPNAFAEISCSIVRACFGGIAFALLSIPAVEAGYGPRIIVGSFFQQTSDAVSVNPASSTPGSTCNSISCYVLLRQLPSRQQGVIQHVSCRIFLTGGAEVYSVRLRTRRGSVLLQQDTELLLGNTASNRYVVNASVLHLLRSNERPLFYIQTNMVTNISASCTISGRVIGP